MLTRVNKFYQWKIQERSIFNSADQYLTDYIKVRISQIQNR